MWARHIELMLGLWLLISPFVFRHGPDDVFLWANDLACGTLIVVLALAAHWRPLARAHLVTLAVSVWLVAAAWVLLLRSDAPALQNELTTGLLVMILAVVPSDVLLPPYAWRRFYAERAQAGSTEGESAQAPAEAEATGRSR